MTCNMIFIYMCFFSIHVTLVNHDFQMHSISIVLKQACFSLVKYSIWNEKSTEAEYQVTSRGSCVTSFLQWIPTYITMEGRSRTPRVKLLGIFTGCLRLDKYITYILKPFPLEDNWKVNNTPWTPFPVTLIIIAGSYVGFILNPHLTTLHMRN